MLPDYQIFAATWANMYVLNAVLFLVVVKLSRHAVLLAVDGVLQCVCPVGVSFDSFDVLCHNNLFLGLNFFIRFGTTNISIIFEIQALFFKEDKKSALFCALSVNRHPFLPQLRLQLIHSVS